tara:strand:+ start:402 stop:1115 length:714 start_codon:yes stop_codon:yes gene_type:complete
MYDEEIYHKNYYDEYNITEEIKNVLSKFNSLNKNKSVSICDYGCGNGYFLNQLKNSNRVIGVEYNKSYIDALNKKYEGVIKFVDNDSFFNKNSDFSEYDFIFLNDVLEHLINPQDLMNRLKDKLSSDGMIIITGPIEENNNLIYKISKLFGFIKKIFNIKNNFIPYHIYRTSNYSQKLFFKNCNNLDLISFETYETGWPYKNNGFIRNLIANINFFIYSKNDHCKNNRFLSVLKRST